MEPLKPTTRARLLADRPQAAPGDVEEYERLLAEQFIEDPDVQPAPQATSERVKREDRLRTLHSRLFGDPSADEKQEK